MYKIISKRGSRSAEWNLGMLDLIKEVVWSAVKRMKIKKVLGPNQGRAK